MIPQVGFGKDRMCANLTFTFIDRKVVKERVKSIGKLARNLVQYLIREEKIKRSISGVSGCSSRLGFPDETWLKNWWKDQNKEKRPRKYFH